MLNEGDLMNNDHRAAQRGQRRSNRRRDFGTIAADGTATHPSFSVRWHEGGRKRQKRGFRTKTEAAAFLARIRTALADGVLDQHRKSEVTLVVVGEEWLKNHSAVRLRSHQDNSERWQRLADFFGRSAFLSEVTPSRILELRARLAQGLAPATVNRYLALLRSVLNYAVTAGYLQQSPLRRLARGTFLLPEFRAKLDSPLKSTAEGARLLRHVPPEWRTLFAVLLYTGMRRGEVAGLRWEDIDLSRRMITVRRSYNAPPKSGKARTIPVPDVLARILVEHRARDTRTGVLVFVHPVTGEALSHNVKIGLILDAACERTGVPRMRVHDLRHAYASLMIMAGGSLTDVQRNLGHSTPVLTSQTYGHLTEDHRVDAANRCFPVDLSGPGDGALALVGEPVKGGRQ
jgi:integrase